MEFDGALGKEGVGIDMWIHGPLHQPCNIPRNVRLSSYKLDFDCSNNEVEYKALIADLKIMKKLGAKRISVYGDTELITKQVKGEYWAKHPRTRAYRNVFLDIPKTFSEYTLSLIPRSKNMMADSLATATSMVKIPTHTSKKYSIHVKHCPTVPNNLRYWQVFWDDKQINNFL